MLVNSADRSEITEAVGLETARVFVIIYSSGMIFTSSV
jgi:hypothetical protein